MILQYPFKAQLARNTGAAVTLEFNTGARSVGWSIWTGRSASFVTDGGRELIDIDIGRLLVPARPFRILELERHIEDAKLTRRREKITSSEGEGKRGRGFLYVGEGGAVQVQVQVQV